MVKSKKHDKGYIERKDIILGALGLSYAHYFLIVSDISTHQLITTYGPFETADMVKDFAKLHGIEVAV